MLFASRCARIMLGTHDVHPMTLMIVWRFSMRKNSFLDIYKDIRSIVKSPQSPAALCCE